MTITSKKNPISLIVICGPTASGKTALGVDMALRFNCEILSADSRQVYRGLDIGTGKDLDEYIRPEGTVPCHLIDMADPRETYSLYRYMEDFHKALDGVLSRKKLPVLVGGTGLYIEAAIKGYDVPAVPEDEELRKELMQMEREELERRLLELDPAIYARTDLSSKKRIVRSLEIAGHGIHSVNRGSDPPTINPLIMVTRWPREELVARIDRRLEDRLNSGMVEEVRSLLDHGIPAMRLMDLGMEYRYITMYCQDVIGYDDMKESLKVQIHRLAKRQMTWFRGMERRGLSLQWIERADRVDAFTRVEKFLSSGDTFHE